MSRFRSSLELRNDLDEPYLLVSSWPVHLHQGEFWTDSLWAKDLLLHLHYIADLHLACPVERRPPAPGMQRIPSEEAARIRLEPMPRCTMVPERIRNWIPFATRLLQLIDRSSFFHFTAAEHPLLYGFLVPLLRRTNRVGIIGFVESSFWRKPDAKGLTRWISIASERMVKRAISSCHVTFLTQSEYLETLANPDNSNHVTPAVWVDSSRILPRSGLSQLVFDRLATLPEAFRISFFGQLREAKGLDVLIDACIELAEQGGDRNFHLDVHGSGPLEDEYKKRSSPLGAKITFHGTIPYDDSFFERIRNSHVVVVPSRSDERPRIVWDAFSQAAVVVASATPGLSLAIRHGENGLLVEPGSAHSLANALLSLRDDPDSMGRLADAALRSVEHHSHQAMHQARSSALRTAFPHHSSLFQEFA